MNASSALRLGPNTKRRRLQRAMLGLQMMNVRNARHGVARMNEHIARQQFQATQAAATWGLQ